MNANEYELIEVPRLKYNHQDWPNFTFDPQKVYMLLADVMEHYGAVKGRFTDSSLEITNEVITKMMADEIVSSAEIEGEYLKEQDAIASIKKTLFDKHSEDKRYRNTDGFAEALIDAVSDFDAPLTRDRLFHWHRLLFPDQKDGHGQSMNVGAFTKDRMVIQSGEDQVIYMAPPVERINMEMNMFLSWFNANAQMPAFIKAGIAHLYFEIIHPFEDGNGRIGRLLIDRILAQHDRSSLRLLGMSSFLKQNQKEYYQQLNYHSKGNLDATDFVLWFLNATKAALEMTSEKLDQILIKERFWRQFRGMSLNDRQRKILELLLSGEFVGDLTAQKWTKLGKCSLDTALRDIDYLVEKGALKPLTDGQRKQKFGLGV
ncbi:Fic family protein [Persicobacter psychrovividus]|uniref:Cell division protein Fic n=1 Tax=Persicobacter psychrovividus TaxID=387638 RepID=A0ABN6LH50_9BACT|nr:cell division protein Fic [Persicobacter psychrovividus]